MTNKEEILEVLNGKELTSKEISELTEIKIEHVLVYLNDLHKRNKVIRVNDSKPYKYKNYNEKALLDTLREMFENGVIKVYQEKLTKKYKKCLEEL